MKLLPAGNGVNPNEPDHCCRILFLTPLIRRLPGVVALLQPLAAPASPGYSQRDLPALSFCLHVCILSTAVPIYAPLISTPAVFSLNPFIAISYIGCHPLDTLVLFPSFSVCLNPNIFTYLSHVLVAGKHFSLYDNILL